MYKIKSQTPLKYFKTSSVNQLISILQISLHPTAVYHHSNQASLHTEFQLEAPHYGRTFLETLSVTVFKKFYEGKASRTWKWNMVFLSLTGQRAQTWLATPQRWFKRISFENDSTWKKFFQKHIIGSRILCRYKILTAPNLNLWW